MTTRTKSELQALVEQIAGHAAAAQAALSSDPPEPTLSMAHSLAAQALLGSAQLQAQVDRMPDDEG